MNYTSVNQTSVNQTSQADALAVDISVRQGTFSLTAKFRVSNPGVTAIYGKSGAGKTTLLRAIAGLSRAEGTVHVGEQVWQDKHRYLETHQRPVGFVFQEPSLFEHLTVRGNLEFGMRRRGAGDCTQSWDEIVSLLRLETLLTRSVIGLSGGEQQRVAIGRALLSNPRLLLMDEPLSSLDAPHKLELLAYLETLQRQLQLPMLYVSHSPDEVARLADDLVLMENGSAVASGPASEMLTRLDLPLSHDDNAAAVVTAFCTGHEKEFSLSLFNFDDNTLHVPGDHTHHGVKPLKLRILARDVSLTLERQHGTSILNIVPARVLDVLIGTSAQCMVRLDCSGQVLLARITRKSAAALDLQVGQNVYAQIKSVALL